MEGLFESSGIVPTIVPIILFVIGMVLIIIEMFIPGIGIFGGLGLLALIAAIVLTAQTVLQGFILFLIIAAIIVVLALIVSRSFRKGRLYKSSLVLKNQADSKEGYVSNEDFSRLVGKSGVSITTLRPAGTIDIDGEKADVVTDGEFLKTGTAVTVVKVSGRRILVKKAGSE